MPTLDPGVHNHDQAPWWEFCVEGYELPVVKQWMNQAAEVFGQEISKRCAGGAHRVEQTHMSVDGMAGYYICHLEFHPTRPVMFTVHRGSQTMEPQNVEQS
jgi:hypothetical protein